MTGGGAGREGGEGGGGGDQMKPLLLLIELNGIIKFLVFSKMKPLVTLFVSVRIECFFSVGITAVVFLYI